MPTTPLCHTYYTHRETARKLGSVCVGFGPTGIVQLCDQLEKIGWTSSVMSLKKNIGQDICKKYWQGLIGDKPKKILAKIFAKKTGRVSSVMSSNWPEVTVGGTTRLWLFIFSAIAGGLFTCGSGLDWKGGGLEWSSAKGLVAPCCNLLSASILSSELPIEVFRSFGPTRIIYWPLFFCNKSLWFCSHVAKI